MSKFAVRALVLSGVIALLGVGSFAIAGGGSKEFKTRHLNGYEENPDISTVAGGSFEARLSNDGTSIRYRLSYSGLEGAVTQAHVHFGKTAINAGISFWLCETTNVQSPSASTPTCPSPGGTVEGTITAAEVIGPNAQGIEPGNLAVALAAMRAGSAYANVHSTKWLGGEIRAQIEKGGSGGGGIVGDDD